MISSQRRDREAEVDRLIAEFFMEQYPSGGTRAELCGIGQIDSPFFRFWRKQDEEHGAVCPKRSTHGNCATCDALQEIRPGPTNGISSVLRQRVLCASAGDPFGRLTIRLSVLRASGVL